MSRIHHHPVRVHFGDCDPAGIVHFPNFSRWMDQSSLAFFMACGLPPWRVLQETRGIVGTPVLEVNTRYIASATYGEDLVVETSVEEWRAKVFVHRHGVLRGDTLLCESREVRAFVGRDPDTGHLKALPVPDDIRQTCG